MFSEELRNSRRTNSLIMESRKRSLKKTKIYLDTMSTISGKRQAIKISISITSSTRLTNN